LVPDVFGGVINAIEAAAPHASATRPKDLAQSGGAVVLDGTCAADRTSGDDRSRSNMAQPTIERIVQIAI
jgi:hypothetical protein